MCVLINIKIWIFTFYIDFESHSLYLSFTALANNVIVLRKILSILFSIFIKCQDTTFLLTFRFILDSYYNNQTDQTIIYLMKLDKFYELMSKASFFIVALFHPETGSINRFNIINVVHLCLLYPRQQQKNAQFLTGTGSLGNLQ